MRLSINKGVALTITVLALLLAAGTQAKADFINAGFETGDFTGWTQGGNTTFTAVVSTYAPSGPTVYNPNTGHFFALLGPENTPGSLSQNLATNIGDNYLLTWYLASDGQTPNDFLVQVNSTTVVGPTTIAATGTSGPYPYAPHTYTFTAAGTITNILFGFQDDPSYLALDDVSLVDESSQGGGPATAPEPAGLTLLGFGGLTLLGYAGLRRRKAVTRVLRFPTEWIRSTQTETHMRMSKISGAAVVVALACLVWGATPAHAAFMYTLTITDGTGSDTVSGTASGAGNFSGTAILPDVEVDFGSGKATQSAGLGKLTYDASVIQGANGPTTITNLTITLTVAQYILPSSGGATVKSLESSTDTTPDSYSVSMKSYILNSTNTSPQPVQSVQASATTPTASPDGSGFNNSSPAVVFPLGEPYQIQQVATFNMLLLNANLGEGADVTFTTNVNSPASLVPEPRATVSLLSALPLFGALGLWRLRKRKIGKALPAA